MQQQHIVESNALVVRLPSEVLMSQTPTYRAALLRHMDDGVENIIVDLSGVRYMDSSGLSILVSLHKKAREQGGRVVLVSPNDGVRALIELTSLNQLFDIYADEKSAIEQCVMS
ncbi:STAS domain-containing protein [Alloalcanivorax sp. C16-2]|uniref:STAS domain-containing protein n=1 Tax=Alloalcanivorax sp. C16-2 TaxID=3390052 RepID=UPI003970BA71